jgi:hypothetical protein
MRYIDLIHRTSVRKRADGAWWLSYTYPYGGPMEMDFDSWQEAMDAACAVESGRVWA